MALAAEPAGPGELPGDLGGREGSGLTPRPKTSKNAALAILGSQTLDPRPAGGKGLLT